MQAKSPTSKREKKPSRLQHFRGFFGFDGKGDSSQPTAIPL